MLAKRMGGMPLFKPTVYSISMIRGGNASTATIVRNLQAIMHLYTWANNSGFDLEQRFGKGDFLNLIEIDSLTDAVGMRYDHLKKMIERNQDNPSGSKRIVPSIERFRTGAKTHSLTVDSATKAVRLRYICNYLDWLAFEYLKGVLSSSGRRAEIESKQKYMSHAIQARIPTVRNLSFFGKREGLSHEAEKRMREVINPQSQENPWQNQNVRIRNHVFILTSLTLGIRRGELLLARVKDVNFQEGTLLIRRAPDDPNDPRTYQPNAKTRDRILPLEADLCQLLYDYVIGVRGKIKAAKKHEFLFVALNTGAPLSMASVTKIFATLRSRISDLPNDLSDHVLRHTWNDRFSEMMDKNKVPEEEEKKHRSYLMGWSETSNSAATYTRRHIRKKSKEVSLQLQRRMDLKDDG